MKWPLTDTQAALETLIITSMRQTCEKLFHLLFHVKMNCQINTKSFISTILLQPSQGQLSIADPHFEKLQVYSDTPFNLLDRYHSNVVSLLCINSLFNVLNFRVTEVHWYFLHIPSSK